VLINRAVISAIDKAAKRGIIHRTPPCRKARLNRAPGRQVICGPSRMEARLMCL
jgi:hypothetical protein